VDPTAMSDYAIRYAIENGHIAVVNRLLQERNIDPTTFNHEALRVASCDINFNAINKLLQSEQDEDEVEVEDKYNKIRNFCCFFGVFLLCAIVGAGGIWWCVSSLA
jgi:hypothetical protein